MGPLVQVGFTAEIFSISAAQAKEKNAGEARVARLLAAWGKKDTPEVKGALDNALGKRLRRITDLMEREPRTAPQPQVQPHQVFQKVASTAPMMEKIASIWGCALQASSGCYPSSEKWSAKYENTPFYKRALEVEKGDAEAQIKYAQQDVEAAQFRVKEAQHRARIAGLESQLLGWKAEHVSAGEQKATQEKLAYCKPCSGSSEWSDFFKGSPYYKESLAMERDDAQMRIDQCEQDVKNSARWRDGDSRNLDRLRVDADFAKWKYEAA